MRKFITALASCCLLTGLSLKTLPAQAQGETLEDNINKELLDSELGPQPDDAPPAAEYPYPGAKEEGIVQPETTATQPPNGLEGAPQTASSSHYVAPVSNPDMTLERPVKIDKDSGDYFYDTKKESVVTPADRDTEHTPKAINSNGDYQFDEKGVPTRFSNRPGLEKPVEIKSDGSFKYATTPSPTSATASFRVGFFGPPMLVNADYKTATFQNIYTKDQLPVLFGDYEWPLTSKLGHLGLKFSSGIFVASGQGQFAVIDPNRRADDTPQERYTFLMFPNTLTAQYRFQYKDTQPVVPYIEGGAGYFTFTEFRDDNATPAIGGALTAVVAGGVNFLLDWLDPESIRNLDTEYGINHVFLTLEAREIVGLNKSYDFTSSVFNAGFLLQF